MTTCVRERIERTWAGVRPSGTYAIETTVRPRVRAPVGTKAAAGATRAMRAVMTAANFMVRSRGGAGSASVWKGGRWIVFGRRARWRAGVESLAEKTDGRRLPRWWRDKAKIARGADDRGGVPPPWPRDD